MQIEHLIKKYPNRRLYDTTISAYVTLEDILKLVKAGERFRVVDSKTEEDITRGILLQIILEQEERGRPIFSVQTLEQIIRTYGDATQDFMATFLEESLAVFLEQQKLMRQQMDSFLQSAPLSIFGEMSKQNLRLWQTFQDAMLQGLHPKSTENGKTDKVDPAL